MAKKKHKSKTTKQPTLPKHITTSNSMTEEVIVAALKSVPVLMKVCRLCETKDGPFLNIFDADKVTAKKIEELMPFGVAENDDLPHKICFRCSAKVEELHEFIQKCIKAQENLRLALGKQGSLTMKSKQCVLWEQQLKQTKLSNDDICDVLIKRAMEGIPLNAPLDEEEKTQTAPSIKSKVEPVTKVDSSSDINESDDDVDESDADVELGLNHVKLSINKTEESVMESRPLRTSRSNKPDAPSQYDLMLGMKIKSYSARKPQAKPSPETKPPAEAKILKPDVLEIKKVQVEKPIEAPTPQETAPPFNIMDHVCVIKVNGVGILFQCKLCNRNFLKKDIVMNHGCAKNSVPKEINQSTIPVPEAPKPSTVKYIKMDKDFKKPLSSLVDKTVEQVDSKAVEPEVPKPKPKPKVGPASRVKHGPPPEASKEPTPPPKPAPQPQESPVPSVHFPTVPSLNSRYKLVPGPNNTFTLVEENPTPEPKPVEEKPSKAQQKAKKRKPETSGTSQTKHCRKSPEEKSSSPEVIDLDTNQESQSKPEPYPVGLFQPVPHHSSVYPPSHPPVPFTTPAMKKQSYTIVQTGNPSKLLISTKPQPVAEPTAKKKKKKPETEEKIPYKVTLEDAAPPKDSGFFTFISVDPLLQPSYVLPTDNIIQESQITTSTAGSKPPDKDNDKYSCNMCGENFSREKKLLTHIQSHYNQMDEEDQMREKSGPKRRSRKT